MTHKPGFTSQLEALMPELRAFARSLCHDMHLADDLVQQACLKAWSAWESFDQDRPMRPWMFKILRNEFYQHKRRSWRQETWDSEAFETQLVNPCSAESLAEFGQVERYIQALPSDQREAMILIVAAGFSYAEAAVVLGCSEGTVKSRVSRARSTIVLDSESGKRPAMTMDDPLRSNLSALDNLLQQAQGLVDRSKAGSGLSVVKAA